MPGSAPLQNFKQQSAAHVAAAKLLPFLVQRSRVAPATVVGSLTSSSPHSPAKKLRSRAASSEEAANRSTTPGRARSCSSRRVGQGGGALAGWVSRAGWRAAAKGAESRQQGRAGLPHRASPSLLRINTASPTCLRRTAHPSRPPLNPTCWTFLAPASCSAAVGHLKASLRSISSRASHCVSEG